jgi:hypothetical protein
MPNDEDEQKPEEQNRIDRSLPALTGSGRPFSVETLLGGLGWMPLREDGPQHAPEAQRHRGRKPTDEDG